MSKETIISDKTKVFSGVQPTGNLHLGNYLGAIKNWVTLQNDHNCIFSIVDLHSITVKHNPDQLQSNIYNIVAAYIACGIDIKKSIIFAQSSIASHCELAWIFNCITPLGWLNRMTQFKEKAGKNKQNASLGLYSYPILMAADILLYKADYVPVGDDQKQHLELTRDIAQAFNNYYNIDYFQLPEPLIEKHSTRIMSLRDGKNKMSKSDSSDYTRINLSDDADLIANKIKKAKTDALEYISYDKENRPETSNLLEIFASFADKNIDNIVAEYQNKSFKDFKADLAELTISVLSPINDQFNKLLADTTYLSSILSEGRERAALIAEHNIHAIKKLVGFL
ncbi:MAG: tryptophan--tRNA ligase [Pseudomonadota bacterium]